MLSQIVIAVTGIIAIWLTQDKREQRQKYACFFGMAGQPFWFYVTFTAEQWGIFILTIAYTLAWLKGLYTYWINPAKNKPLDNCLDE